MNKRLVLVFLALVAMTTCVRIRKENEENYNDVVRQNAVSLVYSCLII